MKRLEWWSQFITGVGVAGGCIFVAAVIVGLLLGIFNADTLVQKTDFSDGTALTAAQLNSQANNLLTVINGNLDNDNFSGNPDLDYDKLEFQKCPGGTGTEACIVDADISTVGVAKFTSLKCAAESTPATTVQVTTGFYTFNDAGNLTTETFAGGSSPAFANGISGGQERIDLLHINKAGTLAITQGTAKAPPANPPDYPTDKVALCEVLLRPGFTQIKNTDDASEGFVSQDARSFFTNFPGLRYHGNEIREHFFLGSDLGTGVLFADRLFWSGGAGPCTNVIVQPGHYWESLCNAATESALIMSDTLQANASGPVFEADDVDATIEIRFKQVEAVDSTSCFQLGYRIESDDAPHDSGTIPVDGIYFEVGSAAATIRPVIRKDSTSTTGANVTVSTDTWHLLKIVLDASVPNATFTVDGANSETLSGSNFPDDEDLKIGLNFCSTDTASHIYRIDSLVWSFPPSILSP